jgi:uncharacterized protein YceK
MKKSVFLIFSMMAIFLSGCTGSTYVLSKTTSTGSAMIDTGAPAPLKGNDNHGVCLSISPRSSLSIDVECILDYVQTAPSADLVNEQEDHLNPWVRWYYTF